MAGAALAALLISGAVQAEDGVLSGTIKTIRDRGSILIGYRTSAPPFAFVNRGGQPIGFSVDLCHEVAADIAATLGRDLLEPEAPAWQTGVRIAYVPVTPDARLPAVVSGAIDLECSSTTATAERAKTVAFSPVFFLAGTKLMVPAGSVVASYRDLAGRTVAVAAGTTNAAVLHRLASGVAPPVTIVETANLDAAYGMLAAGKADAFASDDVLLAGFLATQGDGARFRIVGDFLSFEPYALAFRRDDPAMADQVGQTFARLASAGRLNALYTRWFEQPLPAGVPLNIPISAQLAEMYRALGQPD